jgi:hypothetical protein
LVSIDRNEGPNMFEIHIDAPQRSRRGQVTSKKKTSNKNYDRGIKTKHQFSTKCIEQGKLLDEET